jgi:hypothetical protein
MLKAVELAEAFGGTELPTITQQRTRGNFKQVDFEGIIGKKPKLDHLLLHQVA